jgi:hypothetical protein
MNNPIINWLNKRYPQNQMLKSPYIGALIIIMFFIAFMNIYRPLNAHESQIASYTITMTIYSITSAIPVILLVKILKTIKYFSKKECWTILKELVSIFIILLGMGIVIYFTAFFVEKPAQRWNLSTFFDSCKYAFLIGSIPFIFFTILNYRYYRFYNTSLGEVPLTHPEIESEFPEKIIQIESRLKKEKLNFYPSQFLYATSEGNYVEFYLNRDNHIVKEIIRNSISDIDKQLLNIPFFFRTHRAFIVNVKKVCFKKGNTLGYRLKLTGIDVEIPVSRQNIKAFFEQFNNFN